MPFFILLFLCFVSAAVGIGILYLLGFRNEDDSIFISSPFIALCVWALILGIGVSLKVPVRILTYLAWGVSLALCLVTFKFYQSIRLFRLLSICVGIALLISLPYVAHGFSDYTGSPFPDGWSYIAFGQYLWGNLRCVEGELAPLYQYAAHLCHTRFVASSLLGFISPLAGLPGDTQAASGYFFPWAFFVYASTCAFFISKRVFTPFVWGYITLCVISGSLFTMMVANNFDQALSIGFLPALAGIFEAANLGEKRWSALLALILASNVYIYPEMTPFIFFSALVLLIFHIIKRKIQFTSLIYPGVIFFLLFGLFVSAYSVNWFNFIYSQLSTLQAAVRPGESIATELISKEYWFLGIWGLGGADIGKPAIDWVRYFCASLLSFYLLIGFYKMARDKKIEMIIVQIFLGGLVAYFIVVQRYSYGAYKLISLLWWLISYSIILAVDWIQSGASLHFIGRLNKYVFIFILVIVICVNFAREWDFDKSIAIRDITPYKEILTVESFVNGSPVGVLVTDPMANIWAMYYLRDSKTYFFSYQSYPSQPHVLPFMLRSHYVQPSEIQYIITDQKDFYPQNTGMVWHNSVYSLWNAKEATCFIVDISNPNGVDLINGENLYWLDNQKTLIEIHSLSARTVSIVADFTMGPSLPDMTERNIMVTTMLNGLRQSSVFVIKSGQNEIIVPIGEGNNIVELSVLDRPTVSSLPNGDPRVLLLGLQNIQIHSQKEISE